jgi:hypothetical protein
VRRRSRQWVRPSLRRSAVPERERVSGERRLGAVRGPGNAAQREAPTPGSDVRRGALETEPWGLVECALRMPDWRFGGVPYGTGGDTTNLRLIVLLVNPTKGLTRHDCVQAPRHADRQPGGPA